MNLGPRLTALEAAAAMCPALQWNQCPGWRTLIDRLGLTPGTWAEIAQGRQWTLEDWPALRGPLEAIVCTLSKLGDAPAFVILPQLLHQFDLSPEQKARVLARLSPETRALVLNGANR